VRKERERRKEERESGRKWRQGGRITNAKGWEREKGGMRKREARAKYVQGRLDEKGVGGRVDCFVCEVTIPTAVRAAAAAAAAA
jgi:hypothetical protein